jgi:hypothetical protein
MKPRPAVFHQEADGAAVRAAAEAVIELLGGADREGGGLFAVEGAAGDIVRAGLFQGQVALDDVDDVDAREEFLDEFWNHAQLICGIMRAPAFNPL